MHLRLIMMAPALVERVRACCVRSHNWILHESFRVDQRFGHEAIGLDHSGYHLPAVGVVGLFAGAVLPVLAATAAREEARCRKVESELAEVQPPTTMQSCPA